MVEIFEELEIEEQPVGRVTHYYSRIGVATVELGEKISMGDILHFAGTTTDFDQEVTSLEVDNKEVMRAEEGEEVGIKVLYRTREGDEVFKIIQPITARRIVPVGG